MKTPDPLDIWWLVPNVVAGMSMPLIHPDRYDAPGSVRNAFQDELPLLWDEGVRAIVCLLNAQSLVSAYDNAGFVSHLMPIENGDAPTMDQFREFHRFFEEQRSLGLPVAVHCEAGIGRTGVVLAGILVSEGISPEEAVARVRLLRSGAVETARQFQFLRELSVSLK